MMNPIIALTLLLLVICDEQSKMALAQSATGAVQASSQQAVYNCDPAVCQLANNCHCASVDPPNGLLPKDTPQFVTITFDDSVQPTLLETAYDILNVTNPNGCPARGTWFVSIQYTDFSLVQQWYSSGNEVADHTFTHVGSPSAEEINSCRSMLHAYGGIPNGMIQGFRAPFLNYTKDTLALLKAGGFLYDSSAGAIAQNTYWPYTLDHGLVNDCWKGICTDDLKLPGLWEIPMYAVPDGKNNPQVMDVYMAGTPEEVAAWSMDAFEKHYNGGRQPFGIYIHPTHLTAFPGLPDPKPKLDGLKAFIKAITNKPDVWVVTNQQLLKWMKNPVKASELAKQDYMKCQQPVIAKEICNGLDDDNDHQIDNGLTNSCNLGTTTFKTCFNCPITEPSLENPVSTIKNDTAGYRYPLPDNCDTKWWDPIGNTCLCTSSACEYKDTAIPLSASGSRDAQGQEQHKGAGVQSMAPNAVMLALAVLVASLI